MKPFTKKMWMMIAAAFIYTGAVVWFLEHRTNPEFKGPWHNQLAMGIWFSFSTFFFTQGRLNSNFTRIVAAVWLFVVLVLTSSYTASVSSILTMESLEPRIADIKSLGINRDIFVANYVFPKGSPLVSDISTSILSLYDDGTLKRLEEKWISFDLVSCPRPTQDKTRGSLGLENFWVLFATTGATSILMLLLFLARLLAKSKSHSWFRGTLLNGREEANPQLENTYLGSPPDVHHVIENVTPESTDTTNAV